MDGKKLVFKLEKLPELAEAWVNQSNFRKKVKETRRPFKMMELISKERLSVDESLNVAEQYLRDNKDSNPNYELVIKNIGKFKEDYRNALIPKKPIKINFNYNPRARNVHIMLNDHFRGFNFHRSDSLEDDLGDE